MRKHAVISESGMVNPENDETYAEAADWFARLHDAEISMEETMEWQRLMASNPRFAAAYAGIEEIWNAVGKVRSPPLGAPDDAKRDAYDGSIPVSKWLSRQRRAPVRWRTPALLAASVAGVALTAYWVLWSAQPAVTVLQTPAGQNQAFILADGSRLNLGASTRLEVKLDAKARDINLVRGEAFFSVAKDRDRPFTVHAGDATVTAVGTEFSVNRGADQVVVAVIEGRVLVGSRIVAPKVDENVRTETKQLGAGEQILVSAAAGPSARLGKIAIGIGWEGGRLAFQSEPLSRVLQDVNRYAPKPIALDDPSIGDLMITGTVVRDDVSGWLASLEKSLPVRIVEESQRVTIRSR
jgi:transmembrane sensor